MFWPLVLPFQITFGSLAAFVVIVTAISPRFRWKRIKAFFLSMLLAVLAFIPSCAAIATLLDGIRFGYFEYATFNVIQDFRAERYLPPSATQIKMHKYVNGYCAQYRISEADFHEYLDRLWNEYGQYSTAKRGEYSGDGWLASDTLLERRFADLGWKPLEHPVQYHSPTEADGGSATYYYDATVGIAYQQTGYW